ncbi:uncharacterized protein MONOS_6219 [Monocercomonoides exilis]|uniref:uncharacterized protein n=1 Tax=Monocercomonoides exilis TaxID=2049356 RepID=UPI00355A4EA4|nr:hypothetical protein MONOS_6219 [Monocercomonoides exilis]|eukprot:MONOS_6219.1-p1 / transcript=MONOS_6219.1 / gene=MONOS_6219 / organism=Monocercomonoides_exilis_PA203 / gene_product=unspecified product / transcript_product=unspecified product / location=Mono_scaffold00193:21729-28685(-) / protein_length=2318 / sequence_SO=supercontig / SO=protein_coding / is_pseudo=false
MLSGIYSLISIICVQCLCNGFTSSEGEQAEKSTNERNIYCLKNPWEDMLQNDASDGKYVCEVFAEGNEDGTKGAEKHEKGMNNCVKMLNEGYNRIKDENPEEKMKELIFYEEQKIRGKGRYFGESMIEGCLILHNSSMNLKSLGLRQNDGENIIKAGHGCHVELNDCEVIPLSETSPFCLSGSCGLFTNISLRSSSTTFLQVFPSLFSSKALEVKYSGKCVVSVSSSHFSSFCVSSAPFISSPSIPLASLSYLSFFNISTATSDCSSSSTSFYQTSCLMSCCSFSSTCDVYDGGIVLSLNNPFSSLTASNSSFIGCFRTRNVECIGSKDVKHHPGRQNETFNGANAFIWCEWNGSKTTGTENKWEDGVSSGGAICMYSQSSASVSIEHCSFNDCYAYCDGGGVMCAYIESVEVVNNSFNACTSQNNYGGGMFAYSISSCVMISGCEFQKCKANSIGGGLYLYTFQVSGSGCIGTESGKWESACVLECSFTSCSVSGSYGGGMYFFNVSEKFKMRSLQFISCSAYSYGGGLDLYPYQSTAPSDNHYCYFLFFHDCRCTNTTPYGHDVYFRDYYNHFSSNNPFYESYTTNSNDTRVCYYYNSYQHTEKKDWLSVGMKDRYVGVGGDDSRSLCGMSEATPCKTVGHAVDVSLIQLNSTITVLDGKHVSEKETINVGEKKINVLGKGKTASLIGTNSLSFSSTTLFSVSTGQLDVGHIGIDHNTTRSPSPSVFVVTVGSGTLSLEDVLINSSISEESEISSSAFVMELFQLRMSDVEIKNMAISQPLFAEPSSAGSSSGESLLGNVTIRNVNRTTKGDGVVMAKSVKEGETFVVWNTTIEECECVNGNGGGIKVELLSSASKVLIGDSISHSGGTTSFNQCKCSKCGGGIFLSLADANAKFELSNTLVFERNEAEYGRNMFILASDLNKTVTNESFNFDYSSMINDNNLFVGSDSIHSNKDLFMFLVPYSSYEIFISSKGFDVARCGSEEEPCFTMWKGMENMKKEIGMKTIQINGSSIIQDSFNMSNYQIKKSVKMGKENANAVLNFEQAIESQLEYFMVNNVHLELSNIQLQITSGFDNSAKTIISNKNGELVITGCSFHSEAGMNNGFDCVFVDVVGGSVEVNDLSMESCNIGNSIFVIHDSGMTCHFLNVRVESLNESGGCLLLIKGSESGLKINEVDEEMNLNIDNSSFSGVKRSDNGPTILESMSENKICLVMNESSITDDKAETSEKGGAIFFTFCASGSMKMIDSTISHCSCTNGKGGGVYLATKERGELNFTFMEMKFSANTAKVGNDIFIECFNISFQINENQFQFDLREGHFNRDNAIYGRDKCEYKEDTNLMVFITIHQSDTIIVSSVNGSDERQCGTSALPCHSIDYGLMHLTSDFMSVMIVVEESAIGGELDLKELSLSSKNREVCKAEVETDIERTREALMTTTGTVSLMRVNFVFDSNFTSSHESFISPEGGILEMMNCSFTTKQLKEGVNAELAIIQFHIIKMEKGELQLDGCTMSNLILQKSSIYLSSSLPSVIYSFEISNSTISHSLIEIIECEQLNMDRLCVENISMNGDDESLISCLTMKNTIQLTNCTMGGVNSKTTKGKLMKAENCLDVKMDSCIFDGSAKERNEQYLNTKEEMCRWSGSLVDVVKSNVEMKDTTISHSPDGGITMSRGNIVIEKGEFLNNNPSIEGYPSLRRNIICSDSGTLNVMSLKGGDGLERNASLWMLNDGCSFERIASERDSSFFIPVLESVEAKEETDRMKLTFKGMLLVPCNLSFSVVKKKGEEKEIEKHDFDSSGFLSEREAKGSVGKDLISNCGNEIEVSTHILFGNSNTLFSTNSFILKNLSETEPKGDERIVEGGKEMKSYWLLIVVVCIVIVVLLFVIVIILAVRWRKARNEAKDLREIANDNIRKDPKLIEMVTMEMSPEEQWRRAEREAEKKNEERIKKRVYDKTLEHSESSEHLLSESGSTEYILGRDSDKIPEWALEKEEEEEKRKRTPSPSISSTDTSDTESTFVRGQDLCPTTSSMSNLVDAMACSSPHEKLIVDLRDSLFMLLHGRNEKKEMAIGSLKEREQTASQILFWVANLALHSFDEMENKLQSLANLSPHIVLFSEHMVICVVMHSDFLSSDDSDSSSVSSSAAVTSTSEDDDDSDSDSLPSSAFEDEDDYKKECLRWMAPELLINKKMGATKESVAFSIGMMLWECLTLEIPFGEYEAVIAGEKIRDGQRPDISRVSESSLKQLIGRCLSEAGVNRPSLGEIKRETFQHFVGGGAVMTMSDAICYVEGSSCVREERSCTEKEAEDEEEDEKCNDEKKEKEETC